MNLSELRKAIDDADEIILRAIAARFEGARQIKELKKEKKIPVRDPEREEVIKSHWKKRSDELSIRQELALLVLDFLLEESRRIQSE